MKIQYVTIRATREQLHDCGICSNNTFDLLLSGCKFAVERASSQTYDNKIWLKLVHPKSPTHILWVRESLTVPV